MNWVSSQPTVTVKYLLIISQKSAHAVSYEVTLLNASQCEYADLCQT